MAGLIYNYNKSPQIYHCPADNSSVDGHPAIRCAPAAITKDISIYCDAANGTYRKTTGNRLRHRSSSSVRLDRYPGSGHLPGMCDFRHFWPEETFYAGNIGWTCPPTGTVRGRIFPLPMGT